LIPASKALKTWLQTFCNLHERSRREKLSAADESWYRDGRNELAQLILRAQGLSLRPGQIPRRTLRVVTRLELRLRVGDQDLRGSTHDLSSGGFSMVVPTAPALLPLVRFEMRVRDGAPVAGEARPVSSAGCPEGTRLGFAFEGVTPENLERIERMVFDEVVASLKRDAAAAEAV
jgi:hypothetical protein